MNIETARIKSVLHWLEELNVGMIKATEEADWATLTHLQNQSHGARIVLIQLGIIKVNMDT